MLMMYQVQKRDGSWIETHPPQGTVMVNIGDMMQRWTSDTFISTVHLTEIIHLSEDTTDLPLIVCKVIGIDQYL